ncbi:MAG: hypothetical protein F4X64_17630 [Chloroflexi bacterium]|nr:hypothetical protein [Chloroflexota bacterium]
MTTINTSDDLLRLLREDSTFYAEARRLVLSDELLALPERFAALANRVDGFIEEQRAVNERVDGFIEEQRAVNERVDGFIEEQKATNEEQRVFNQRVDEFIEEQRATNRRLETAIGELRGDQAYRACRERADEIAEELGFTVIDIISGLQRRELFRSNPPPTFTPGDRRSFYYADLIMQMWDQQGNPAYLAVEASYTADERDTQRALRNAQYLRHITGLPAYAAIASRQNDRAIQELLDGGSILWYQLPDEAFKPE